MDFNLTDEQRMIQESARRFVAEHYGVHRASGDGSGAARWRSLADLGFLSIGQPEEFGGIGGAVEIAIVCREFGRGPVLEPYISTALFAAQIIARAGELEKNRELLESIASGERIVSVAYRDADEAGEVGSVATLAHSVGDEFVLTGRKSLVLAAPEADLLIVSALAEGRDDWMGDLTWFLVDPAQEGVTIKPLRLVDGSTCGEVTLDRVKVNSSKVLGREHKGLEALQQALRYATLGACSEVSGLCMAALDITSEYIKTRKQFGNALSSFQALRHKVADMAINCEMAKAAVHKLIASFQAPELHDPEMTQSLAKFVLDEIGQRVCSEAIQLHGAMGLTEECAIGRYYARATLIRSLYGATSSHLTNYARLLIAGLEQTSDQH